MYMKRYANEDEHEKYVRWQEEQQIIFWEEKVLIAAASSEVIKEVELFYLSLKVILCIKIISAIRCKFISCFILIGEPVL